jgi:hypothetical protein
MYFYVRLDSCIKRKISIYIKSNPKKWFFEGVKIVFCSKKVTFLENYESLGHSFDAVEKGSGGQ